VAQKANLSFENRFPYIFVIDEASDFKFGKQLQFANPHHEIPLEEKLGVALGLGSSPKFYTFLLIFKQRLKLATSNFVYSSGSPRPIIKSQPEEKWWCHKVL